MMASQDVTGPSGRSGEVPLRWVARVWAECAIVGYLLWQAAVPSPVAGEEGYWERLAALVPADHTLEVRTDEETDFVPAIRKLAATRPVRHVTVSSRARRDTGNPLWMVNHKHRLQRHCLASHRRRTVAAHKTLAGMQDRQLLHRCWLNHTKGVSERRAAGRRTTPAMKLGIAHRARSGRSLFSRRRFPKREGLSEELRAVYEGQVKARPRERVSQFRHRIAY